MVAVPAIGSAGVETLIYSDYKNLLIHVVVLQKSTHTCGSFWEFMEANVWRGPCVGNAVYTVRASKGA